MPVYREIDIENWRRREWFEHYRHSVPCTYAITVELDVTAFAQTLAASPRSTYLAQVWAIAAAVNRRDEFRMTLTDAGRPAVWEVVHPMFTVFHPEDETFSAVWAPFDADFARFHENAERAVAATRRATTMFPQPDVPPNTFDVSSVPWTSFTGFSLQVRDGFDHLAPIFTIGRYVERGRHRVMPIAVQMHHAAADGFHTSLMLDDLQRLLAEPDWI
ncbi:CatA-like O-acetyltransferase [Microbacterium sp. 179-I 3D2 NHS]|uniref:CatA-like O-acetyltransferase n=1 Tax=Microbacterium sp. 179-I 3D2 NHS TaxID=3235178 RepID=UPI0039A3C54F